MNFSYKQISVIRQHSWGSPEDAPQMVSSQGQRTWTWRALEDLTHRDCWTVSCPSFSSTVSHTTHKASSPTWAPESRQPQNPERSAQVPWNTPNAGGSQPTARGQGGGMQHKSAWRSAQSGLAFPLVYDRLAMSLGPATFPYTCPFFTEPKHQNR